MKRTLILSIILLCLTCGCQIFHKVSPELINNSLEGIGVLGPIILDFGKPIQKISIEKAIRIIPSVPLRFQWQGTRLNIFLETPLSPEQQVQVFLEKKAFFPEEVLDQSEFLWSIKTHPECLIYIGSATELPEIWKVCLNNNSRAQLSQSNGKIIDFNVSNDGQWIIYSVKNNLNGSEIWVMDRNGRKNHVLFQCTDNFCHEPNYSSDGLSAIFIRSGKNNENLVSGNNDEVLHLNIQSGKVERILTDQRLNVSFLQWSADQKFISFFNGVSSSFWIVNLSNKQITEIPSDEGLGGTWKRNADSFIFADLNYWGGIPFGQINQWDEKTNSIQHLFGDENEPNEYYLPQSQPQGEWIATAYRPVEGSASKQIALFSPIGNQRLLITNEQAFSYSSYSWSFNGELLAFQRFQIGISNSVPEIGLWRMSDQSKVIIAKNASSLKWIP
jgi:hypothetical protein